MTVCIAAICDSGKAIVVAADRMFTNPGLSVEFETDEQKIERLASSCVALTAGNSVHATEVLERVRRQLGGNLSPSIDQVAEFVREAFAAVRNEKAYQTVLSPMLGADFQKYGNAGMSIPVYMEKQPGMFQQMTFQIQQFNLGADFLVAGLDQAGAHLSHITNPGVCSQLQKLGHAAIGSGGGHAMMRLALAGQNRQRGMLETLADVYSAKKVSEVAPGVGDATDIAVIDAPKGVWACPSEILTELENIHLSLSATMKPDLGSLRSKWDELRK